MNDQKMATFIYEDLGFPIELINVPMRKVLGQWVLDINLNKLQIQVLKLMVQQPVPLQAEDPKTCYFQIGPYGFVPSKYVQEKDVDYIVCPVSDHTIWSLFELS